MKTKYGTHKQTTNTGSINCIFSGLDSKYSNLQKLAYGLGKVKTSSGDNACSTNVKPVSAENTYSRPFIPISDDEANSKQAQPPPRNDDISRQVKRLSESEENAINAVANLLVEILVFGIAAILCLYEYYVITVREEQKRKKQLDEAFNVLENKCEFKIMEANLKSTNNTVFIYRSDRGCINFEMDTDKDPNSLLNKLKKSIPSLDKEKRMT